MLLPCLLIFGYTSALSPERWDKESRDKYSEERPLSNSEEINFSPSPLSESLKIWTFRDASGSRDVRIDSGIVRGHLEKDSDSEYFAFLGIPYAAPPTGSSRFMAPFPPKPWINILYANRTVMCPQLGMGDENCLVVNVFTPTTLRTQLPVFVYIHGGSFLMGSGPTKGLGLLIKQNFIVVTLNYRLGVLGFLCLGIEEALGNAGLKDQTAALQWVQRNIQQFGGDPAMVTVYGMSAGAASVEYHILAAPEGLFQKAIIESGSATSVWSVDPEPIDTAKQFANMLKPESPIRNLEELVHFLHTRTADELSEVNYRLYRSLTDGTFGFVPCVENKYNSRDAFILNPPFEILESRNYSDIPIMFVHSSLEGLYLRSAEYYELDYKVGMNENFLAYMPKDLNIDREPTRKPVIKKVIREYFGPRGVIDDEHLLGYLNFFGDSLIMHGMLTSAEKYAEPGKPVYLLEFAYKSERGGYEQFYEYINLPGHGDIARNLISTVPITSRSDRLTVTRLARLIGNFAKFSDPTPNHTPMLPIKWPIVQPGNLTYLHLDQEFSLRQHYNCSRKRLWDELYALYKKPVTAVNPFIYI
ncbi:esterase E4-like [Cydia amplana]|uniref:esterase E4-like n=1 Tax=Cydia amplana TaxID=1869771 RepID=UPI002FE5454C